MLKMSYRSVMVSLLFWTMFYELSIKQKQFLTPYPYRLLASLFHTIFEGRKWRKKEREVVKEGSGRRGERAGKRGIYIFKLL